MTRRKLRSMDPSLQAREKIQDSIVDYVNSNNFLNDILSEDSNSRLNRFKKLAREMGMDHLFGSKPIRQRKNKSHEVEGSIVYRRGDVYSYDAEFNNILSDKQVEDTSLTVIHFKGKKLIKPIEWQDARPEPVGNIEPVSTI